MVVIRTPLPLRQGLGDGRVYSVFLRYLLLLIQPSPGPSLPPDSGRGVGIDHLFEHTVKIATTKTERADTRPARMFLARQPGAALRIQIDRRFARLHHIQRLRHLDRRRQHLVMHRECSLDQTCDTGGGFGVADH